MLLFSNYFKQIFFTCCLHVMPQLVEKENVKAVVSMNEDYELAFLSNSKQVQTINIDV